MAYTDVEDYTKSSIKYIWNESKKDFDEVEDYGTIDTGDKLTHLAEYNRLQDNRTQLLHSSLGYDNKSTIGAIINRNIFKATKLREDIHAITIRIYNPKEDISNDIMIFVNDKSIWKRFNYYKDESLCNIYTKKDFPFPSKFIKHLKNSATSNNLIYIKFTLEELDLIKQVISVYPQQASLGLGTSLTIPVKIIDVESHNKHLWEFVLPKDMNLGNHTNPTSNMYYDEKFANSYNL